MLNLSNDGWFHGSSEHDMHLAISVFRAVENRVPLARAVNTGISALIDGNGRVLDALPKLTEGVLTGTVPLDDRTSLYSAWGDWLGLFCLAVSIGLLPLALARDLLARLTGMRTMIDGFVFFGGWAPATGLVRLDARRRAVPMPTIYDQEDRAARPPRPEPILLALPSRLIVCSIPCIFPCLPLHSGVG